jgi:hypothetical protein
LHIKLEIRDPLANADADAHKAQTHGDGIVDNREPERPALKVTVLRFVAVLERQQWREGKGWSSIQSHGLHG